MENEFSGESILEKVMAVNSEEELSQFNPVEIVAKLFNELPSREQDILRRRFGLHGKGNETLERIGSTYNVTRERVRQIENAAIKHLKNHARFEDTVKPVELVILAALEKHGGIMAEDHLLEYVLSQKVIDDATAKHLLFLLNKLTSDRLVYEHLTAFRPSWRVDFIDWEKAHITVDEMVRILELQSRPLSEEELLALFRKTEIYATHKAHFNFEDATMEPIYAHLRASKRIKPNPYGEWGLSHWNTVTPKRMGDKIYLVMKKHGEPLHFRDIARLINEAVFDRKRAYPPTVHNELILDTRYVLVGRGIYALSEWGYVPGVVADVIFDVLEKAETPLSRDEIVQRVLVQRMVKKGTIFLALSNNKRFMRDASGKFTVERAV